MIKTLKFHIENGVFLVFALNLIEDFMTGNYLEMVM
jgi:hypothetical protein